jgi:hypothetical protein
MATWRTDHGRLALSWPSDLPAPVLRGDTARYPEALAGVDPEREPTSSIRAGWLTQPEKPAGHQTREIGPATSTTTFTGRVVEKHNHEPW